MYKLKGKVNLKYYLIMDKDALYPAAVAGASVVISKLEMQVDVLIGYETTILHTESEHENTEHVRFIVQEFANKNILIRLDTFPQTALHLASYYGQAEVVEIHIDAARKACGTIDDFQAFLTQAERDLDTAGDSAWSLAYGEAVSGG